MGSEHYSRLPIEEERCRGVVDSHSHIACMGGMKAILKLLQYILYIKICGCQREKKVIVTNVGVMPAGDRGHPVLEVCPAPGPAAG